MTQPAEHSLWTACEIAGAEKLTITVAWVRENRETTELLVASDSRLRSHGAIDQAQKIFRLERRDCCLGFCGDAQVAYPLFVQVGSALNNYERTRTRHADVTDLFDLVRNLIRNYLSSWDLSEKFKAEEVKSTRILFSGWSWKHKRFVIGVFKPDRNGIFEFHQDRTQIPHPWKEQKRSLVFIGDYKQQYMHALDNVLKNRHGDQPRNTDTKKLIKFDYEPLEALALLLSQASRTIDMTAIGGAPQLLRLYAHGNDTPIVVRTSEEDHYLLGRRLFSNEKTGFPVIELSQTRPRLYYPMSEIPFPRELAESHEVENDPVSTSPRPDPIRGLKLSGAAADGRAS